MKSQTQVRLKILSVLLLLLLIKYLNLRYIERPLKSDLFRTLFK
jgi:hypothetical protein